MKTIKLNKEQKQLHLEMHKELEALVQKDFRKALDVKIKEINSMSTVVDYTPEDAGYEWLVLTVILVVAAAGTLLLAV